MRIERKRSERGSLARIPPYSIPVAPATALRLPRRPPLVPPQWLVIIHRPSPSAGARTTGPADYAAASVISQDSSFGSSKIGPSSLLVLFKISA